MIFRALDSMGDWTFGNGIGSFSTGLEALKFNLSTRVKQWKRECFFDLESGVDYNNFMDIGTKDLLDSDLTRVILGSYGIIRIDAYLSTLDTISREVRIEATLFTVYGSLQLKEVF